MNNSEISAYLNLYSKLMDIHGMNAFKSKSLSIAAYKIDRMNQELSEVPIEKISSIEGIGESTAKLISELLKTNKISSMEEIIQKTPEGILEMMKIKGIGPKKISIIWKEMEIESLGELLYACNENRLSLFKGFGKKTQDNVIESIEFYQSQKGNYLYAQIEVLTDQLIKLFTKIFDVKDIVVTGDFRRQNETIDVLEFVVPLAKMNIEKSIASQVHFELISSEKNIVELKYDKRIRIKLYSTEKDEAGTTLFHTTGNNSFVDAFALRFPSVSDPFKNEEDLFKKFDLPYIAPCLRESSDILQLAIDRKIPMLIQPEDIRGIIHCHSNWSDGANTIEQLVHAAMKLGLEYLVISDHSKAAFYANGLTEERVAAQHAEIDKLNLKYPDFKIFKSIECDILSDGGLDYEHLFLHEFDLVITSVHSNLKMTEEKAMIRLIKAIENPHTTILGHMTGRLLLSRKGYPVDYKKIIDACAANRVVIEMNAHPKRLDMRWQWIRYALEKNVLISINPDAHSTMEFGHLKYGVLAAQKGMLTKEQNLSSFSLSQFENYLKQLNKH